MYLQPKENAIAPLRSLWKTVFGDEEAYIDLFFYSVWQHSHTFAAEADGQLVGALYLLDCSIEADQTYAGYYLYAAATLPAYRRRGYMGRLIAEAKAFARAQGKAFIALVPANAPLYAYYESFGFVTAMEQYIGCVTPCSKEDLLPISKDAYFSATQTAPFPRFRWTRDNHAYALDCLAYGGCLPFRTKSAVLLTDATAVKEVFAASADDAKAALEGLPSLQNAAAPFPLPGFERRDFGMIWTESEALQTLLHTQNIYMNLALD